MAMHGEHYSLYAAGIGAIASAVVALTVAVSWSGAPARQFPALSISLAAVVFGSLIALAAIAPRPGETVSRLAVGAMILGCCALGLGSLEATVRAIEPLQGSPTGRGFVPLLATLSWIGRGMLTFAIASGSGRSGRRTRTPVLAATTLGIVGVQLRPSSGVPATVELGASIGLAVLLIGISVGWLRATRLEGPSHGLEIPVGVLSAGLAFAFVATSSSRAAADSAELLGLAWLILVCALAAATLDQRGHMREAQQRAAALDLLHRAEQERSQHERDEIAHSLVRHDSSSSLLAIEAGLHALPSLHAARDEQRTRRMLSFLESETSRVRRMLDDRERLDGPTMCMLAQVLAPLLALHRANGLVLAVDLDDPLVALALSGDDLASAVENILSNCETHAPGARVDMRGRLIQGGEVLLLEIADDGPGIAPHLRASIFEHGVSAKAGPGGLGLYGARSSLRAAGGDLGVDSTMTGASFTMRLPVLVSPPTVGTIVQPCGPAHRITTGGSET